MPRKSNPSLILATAPIVFTLYTFIEFRDCYLPRTTYLCQDRTSRTAVGPRTELCTATLQGFCPPCILQKTDAFLSTVACNLTSLHDHRSPRALKTKLTSPSQTLDTMDAAPPQTQPSIHTLLDPATRQIRLLQILDGDASSRICCTLETYDVAATSYIALSYTWGSEEDSQIVCINGVEFRVRKNLFDYLLVARRCLEKPLLWIDQICIDQGNVRERNHQVSI